MGMSGNAAASGALPPRAPAGQSSQTECMLAFHAKELIAAADAYVTHAVWGAVKDHDWCLQRNQALSGLFRIATGLLAMIAQHTCWEARPLPAAVCVQQLRAAVRREVAIGQTHLRQPAAAAAVDDLRHRVSQGLGRGLRERLAALRMLTP